MRKLYFLGLGAGIRSIWRHVFRRGSLGDIRALEAALEKRYGGKALAVKNGRTGLYFALKAYFKPGDGVIVNGFTCYAVVEAVKAAGLTPVYADINREDLNFDVKTLEKLWGATDTKNICGIIVQNTMGNPVDIKAVERFAGKHGLIIIEDLAHSAGRHYADGREIGTIGAATALSFGKDKAIDTVNGGAVIFRHHLKVEMKAPELPPKKSDSLRARFYPLLGAWCRALTRVHLGGILMRALLKLHIVERSADNKLDPERQIAPWQAKLALEQLKTLKDGCIRDYYFVNNREEVLAKLRAAGYYFDGFWYERPVSPERYYKLAGFDETSCPEAVKVAREIINFPKYYPVSDLKEAREVIKPYLVKEGHEK